MTENVTERYHIPEKRFSYRNASPEAYQTMLNFSQYAESKSTLPKPLLELVKMRASQINGCSFCLDMHSKDAREEEESEQRLYLLNAWREAPFYTDSERAALAWTEAVTLVSEGNVSDEVYNEARKYFSERDLVDLTMAIIAINGWNRLNIAFRTPAGTYEPKNKRQVSVK